MTSAHCCHDCYMDCAGLIFVITANSCQQYICNFKNFGSGGSGAHHTLVRPGPDVRGIWGIQDKRDILNRWQVRT